MGEVQCYEPSSLIESIHKTVPFLTDGKPGDSSADLVVNLGDGTRAFYDYFVVRMTAVFDISCKKLRQLQRNLFSPSVLL